jgi:hypothetical protein
VYRDSLGNTYAYIHNSKRGQPHRCKPSCGGERAYGRSKRRGVWRFKVSYREGAHRNWGHRFPRFE